MPESKQTLNIWIASCAHVHSDLLHNRRSFAEAVEQSENGGNEGGPSFDRDIMLYLGDFVGTHHPPTLITSKNSGTNPSMIQFFTIF